MNRICQLKLLDSSTPCEVKYSLSSRKNDYLKTKVSDTEDAIEELENEVQRLRKTVGKEREFRNDLEQYQRRNSLRFLSVGPDRCRETADDCKKKVLAIINDELGLNYILSADISIAYRVGVRNTKPRPIIVKFLSRKHKIQVIQKAKTSQREWKRYY